MKVASFRRFALLLCPLLLSVACSGPVGGVDADALAGLDVDLTDIQLDTLDTAGLDLNGLDLNGLDLNGFDLNGLDLISPDVAAQTDAAADSGAAADALADAESDAMAATDAPDAGDDAAGLADVGTGSAADAVADVAQEDVAVDVFAGCTSTAACDDGNACTDDTCLPSGLCDNATNTAACDDGIACTTDLCSATVCVGTPVDAACDDGNGCTTDACVAGSGCSHSNTTASCDDLNLCTAKDVCIDGLCVGQNPKVCDDGELCTDNVCNPSTAACTFPANTAPCDDGNICTAGDTCGNFVCAGTLSSAGCDDLNDCTYDSCDPKAQGCVHIPKNDSAPCSDGDSCTLADHCVSGVCQAPLSKAGVDAMQLDGSKPILYKRSELITYTQGITFVANGSWSALEFPWGFCGNQPGWQILPPQYNTYWVNIALDGSDFQMFAPIDLTTIPQTCTPGSLKSSSTTGVVVPLPSVIGVGAGQKFTLSFYFFAGASDVSTCQGGKCKNDGAPCTTSSDCEQTLVMGAAGSDVYTGGGMTSTVYNQPTIATVANDIAFKVITTTSLVQPDQTACDDGFSCTQSACSGGKCTATALDDTLCDDGQACSVDSCSATGCQHDYQDVACDDGVECTADKCAPVGCIHTPVDSVCNPNPCVVGGVCNSTSGCTAGAPAKDGSDCSAGLLCAASATCKAGVCEMISKCNDGDPCTDDSCDPATGKCSAPTSPNGASCTPSNPCYAGICISASCTENGAICTKGQACILDYDCITQRCEQVVCGAGHPCVTDGDCAGYGNGYCFTTGYCMP